MAGRFGGFSLGKRGSYSSFNYYNDPESKKKRYKDEEDYFEDDDDEDGSNRTASSDPSKLMADYRSAMMKNIEGGGETGLPNKEPVDDDDEDPLDAFMTDLETEIRQQKTVEPTKKAIRDDIEEEDDQESYFKAISNAPIIIYDEADELDYDSDGNPIVPEGAKVIDPLPPVDHLAIDYSSFEKNFYEEHKDIKKLLKNELKKLREKMGIKVSGYNIPKPCVSFAHFGFDPPLMELIRKSEFTTPTPIQSQTIPAVLSGRDVIGIAKTGSGKTVSYLWPLLVHCIEQAAPKEGDGPIGLICAPTRELCQQIYHQAKKFAKSYNLSTCCVYGGGSKYEQSLALKDGCEILVATPGRLIDLVRIKATNLLRVTYLVFDEADRMFDLGFEPQVRSIANHVRPDRQTMLFSATFRKKVERLCRDVLTDPVRVVIGDVGEANTDITQFVQVVKDPKDKWAWLLKHIVEFTSAGSVLIFTTRKVTSEEVASSLRQEGYKAGLLHGDMGQGDRDDVITGFKKKAFPILVATDVAARGLDISAIKTVVNYDVARSIDTHVHRIGRTGRAGEKGMAYTLVTPKDVIFAGSLVRNLESADQDVPDDLLQLALQNNNFRKSRQRHNRRGRGGVAGSGGGVAGGGAGRGRGRRKERLGLGATSEMFSSSVSNTPSSIVPRITGPSGDRLSTLKQSMQAQYKMKFQAASSTSFSSTSTLLGPSLSSSATPPISDSTSSDPTPSGSTHSGSTPSGPTPSGPTPSGSTPSGSTPSGPTPSGPTPSGSTPSGSTPLPSETKKRKSRWN